MYEILNTPCFIINKEEIKFNIDGMNRALKKYWNNYIIGYSCKTNSLPWVLNFMRKNNCYAEVVSSYEYKLAKKIGYDDKNIIFNGPNKSKDMFLRALDKGAILNIDSRREIEWLKENSFNKEIKVGVRVNFDLENECPGETSFGKEGSRFGFSYENKQLKKSINELNDIKNVKVIGLHIHNTAKTRSLKIYRAISNMACKIGEYFDYDLDYVDIGGGFFGGVPGKPTYDEYIKEISECLSSFFNVKKTKLIVEPGSALIASPISFLSEVVDVKDTFAKRIVTVNTSRNTIDPFFAKSKYFFRDDCKSNNIINEQIICGYTCLDNDRLMKLDNYKEFKVGDRIIFDKVGAYSMCLAPMFIEPFSRVYVDLGNNKYELVREEWDVEEYIQKSKY
ncbi:pyridoxal-dependent decarboxylase [Clostridium perfringens]|uniref:pyridoxal-dependent decarboxylase n=1 Tax=Clostridium perfringens TaxID=1502 RepID=UPI0024BC9F04|nr:pyridoxal-dependent decarboxylase [Clostridium perfringens]